MQYFEIGFDFYTLTQQDKKITLFLTTYQHKARIDTTSVYRELYVLGLCTAIGVSPDANDWRPPHGGLTAHL